MISAKIYFLIRSLYACAAARRSTKSSDQAVRSAGSVCGAILYDTQNFGGVLTLCVTAMTVITSFAELPVTVQSPLLL